MPPLFSIFYPIYRFCHPVLPFFKQYTCSAAPFFNLFSYIQVLPSCFTISNIVYMFHCPLFSIFFPLYRFCHPVLPSFKKYACSAAPFFIIFSYIQVLPSCFTIFYTVYMFPRPIFQSFLLYTGSAFLF